MRAHRLVGVDAVVLGVEQPRVHADPHGVLQPAATGRIALTRAMGNIETEGG